jgi:hypothetical protein
MLFLLINGKKPVEGLPYERDVYCPDFPET